MAALKRIHKELNSITKDPPPLCTAGPKGEDMYQWQGTIMGPPGSSYEGGIFLVDITFQPDYPLSPPAVCFKTRIAHPNIDSDGGSICLDILGEKWSPALTIANVLLSLCALMSSAGRDERAISWTKQYAMGQSED